MTEGLNLRVMNSDQFLQHIKSMALNDIKTHASELSDEQLTLLVGHIHTAKEKCWKKILVALIAGIENRTELEKIGKLLSPSQFFEILEKRKEVETNSQRKISPLIVGMPHETFRSILDTITPHELALLQQEGYAEPIQHQLTLFTHDITFQLELFLEKLRSLEDAIDSLDPSSLSHHDIDTLQNNISLTGKEATENIHRINNALAIGWNTNREDLIDALSFQKESWQKYDTYVIGSPQSGSQDPTGLYARLYAHLNIIFTNPANPKDINGLKDEEPAIEALVKFSIWYLQDYWDLGLLPQVKALDQLDLDPDKHSNRERVDYRASLFTQAQKNLEKLGLKNVSDLKKHQIFSREILQEYIQKNLSKLTS